MQARLISFPGRGCPSVTSSRLLPNGEELAVRTGGRPAAKEYLLPRSATADSSYDTARHEGPISALTHPRAGVVVRF